MRICITGGGGFLAAHLAKYLIEETDWEVFLWDKFQPRKQARLKAFGIYDHPRIRMQWVDCTGVILYETKFDYIVHLAGKTKIIDSVKDPWSFVQQNIIGMFEVLEFARRFPPKKLLNFSSDETFGSASEHSGSFKEWDRQYPQNPYAATKASADNLCIAWHETYGVPIVTTHCQNIIGETQAIEKFLPTVINKICKREVLDIYARYGEPVQRNFLHAQDVASAIVFILRQEESSNSHGNCLEKYNIAGEDISSLDIARIVAFTMGQELIYQEILTDKTYGLDGNKLSNRGWQPRPFQDGLVDAVKWMTKPENLHWLGA